MSRDRKINKIISKLFEEDSPDISGVADTIMGMGDSGDTSEPEEADGSFIVTEFVGIKRLEDQHTQGPLGSLEEAKAAAEEVFKVRTEAEGAPEDDYYILITTADGNGELTSHSKDVFLISKNLNTEDKKEIYDFQSKYYEVAGKFGEEPESAPTEEGEKETPTEDEEIKGTIDDEEDEWDSV